MTLSGKITGEVLAKKLGEVNELSEKNAPEFLLVAENLNGPSPYRVLFNGLRFKMVPLSLNRNHYNLLAADFRSVISNFQITIFCLVDPSLACKKPLAVTEIKALVVFE